MEKGYYTKHFNIGEDTILSFDANCETKDNHFEAGKLCNTNSFQVVEDRTNHPDYDFTYNDNAFVKDADCDMMETYEGELCRYCANLKENIQKEICNSLLVAYGIN